MAVVSHWLRDAGLLPELIQALGLCTACHPRLFFSHRRATQHGIPATGRMALSARLTASHPEEDDWPVVQADGGNPEGLSRIARVARHPMSLYRFGNPDPDSPIGLRTLDPGFS